MLRSFLVFFAGCARLSVGQTEFIEYPEDLSVFNYRAAANPECGPNEVLTHCAPCPPEDTCYDTEHYICLRSFFVCGTDCLCKEGFIRKTVNDECIPEKESERRCGKNEEYTECKQTCSNETCASIGSPLKCNREEPCEPGCTCKVGYFREDVEDVADPGCVIPRCLCPHMKDAPGCNQPSDSFLN